MSHFGKWLLVSFLAAALALTISLSLGWDAATMAEDMVVVPANIQYEDPPPAIP